MSKLRHYRVFVTAVEQGSLSSAAKVLDVSVAAVSKQIRALEAATKTQLLYRTASGVRPTQLGQRFYAQCREILTAVENAEDGLRSAQASMNGRISITLSRALAVSPVYSMLSEFSQSHPGIRFDLVFNEALQNLQEANIDFALRIGRVDDRRPGRGALDARSAGSLCNAGIHEAIEQQPRSVVLRKRRGNRTYQPV